VREPVESRTAKEKIPLSTADLNNITGENSGGQTVALHAASEGLKAAAGSAAFLSWFRRCILTA